MKASSSFAVTIDNLSHIAAAYSDGVAGRVLHEVWRRLESSLGASHWVVGLEAWGASLRFADADISSFGLDAIEVAVHAAALLPIEMGTSRIVVGLSCLERGSAEGAQIRPQFDIAQYRLDMSAAALAYSALATGTVNFAEQAVAGADGEGDALYHECLIRLSDGEGGVIMPGAYMPAVERLELTRAFDRQVVREIIEHLRQRPKAVLGCNISGLSANNDIWWHSVLGDLQRAPDVAQRLVIEITETALPTSIAGALGFVRAVRNTGCRIALDDFGAGYSTIAFAREAGVDIVKVDGSYVRQRLSGSDADHLLRHLVTLAGDFAPNVVVEGIECEADLQAALEAGAGWVQGYYFRSPATPVRGVGCENVPSWFQQSRRVLQ